MTTLTQGIKSNNLRQEVRQIRETARKLVSSRKAARRFLVSTGFYSACGQLNPQFL
jgi:hypothetical protein